MAQDLNHVVLIGRLTRDLGADERSFGYVANGNARANISIAVNHSRKQGDQWVDDVNYFDVVLYGKMAENLKPYLTKGKQICVDGYLKQDRWEHEGQKRSKISIVANNVQLLGGRDSTDNQNNGAPRFQSVNNTPVQNQNAESFGNPDGFGDDSDIPF